MPRRMAHSDVSEPAVPKRKLNCRSGKSGRTVSSSFGSGIVFIEGSTSPSSPGRYQRAPSLCRKPHTALKLPRSSRPQTSSVSFFAVTAPSGLPVSPGSLSRFLYKPAFGMPHVELRELLPLRLRPRDVAVVLRKRRGGREVAVVADEHHPVRARGDAIRAVLQTVRRDLQRIRVRTARR